MADCRVTCRSPPYVSRYRLIDEKGEEIAEVNGLLDAMALEGTLDPDQCRTSPTHC